MGTNGVNGANQAQRAQLVAQLNAASAKGDFAKVQELSTAILKFDEANKTTETKVEHTDTQPLTPEQQEEKAKANQKALDEIAHMKEKSKMASDAGKFATDTEILKKQQENYDTKEKAQTAFELGDKFKDRRAARKIAKAANQNIESMKSFDALEKIYTNKDEYKAAVEQAKKDGSWDKDNPKFRLLDGKALDGAKELKHLARKKVGDALKSYKLNEEVYKNAKTQEDKDAAFEIMKKAATDVNNYYTASKMFDEKGNIDTKAYQKAMLQYAGSDFKGNLDERKVLAKDADVKKRHTDNMLEAAGLDAEKDYTWAMRGGAATLGLGSGVLTGLLGGGAIATAVATATANATATATANATATATNHWTASNGEEFFDSVEATDTQTATATATQTVAATKTAAISKGTMALNGLKSSILSSVLGALAVKDNGGQDVFNGAAVMDVIENPDQVKGRQNKAIMNQLAGMEITGDPVRDKEIKAAILTTAMSDKTGKKVNTRELLAGYSVAEYLKEHPELVTPKKAEEPVSTPAVSTPTVTTPVTPQPEEDCYNVNEENIRSEIPVIKYGGPWHYSKLYVNSDGSELSEADRRAVQKQLSSGDNAIQNSRDENNKLTGRALKNEFQLPNGKTVKLADDAVDRANNIKGKPGGKDRKYNTASDGKLMWATDCDTGKPISPRMTPDKFAEWERKRAESHK